MNISELGIVQEEAKHAWWAWLVPAFIAAAFWAFGEIVCDEIIDEERGVNICSEKSKTQPSNCEKHTRKGVREEGAGDLPEKSEKSRPATRASSQAVAAALEKKNVAADSSGDCEGDTSREPAGTSGTEVETGGLELPTDAALAKQTIVSSSGTQVKRAGEQQEKQTEPLQKISGELDYMIAGLVDFVLVLCLSPISSTTSLAATSGLPFREELPISYAVCASAICAGVFQSFSWLLHARAFELAPSTELVPLTQLTSIFLFLIDLIQYLLKFGEGSATQPTASLELIALMLIIGTHSLQLSTDDCTNDWMHH